MSPLDANPAHLMEKLHEAIHGLSNALTPVTTNVQLARLMVGDGAKELGDILDEALEASGRAGHHVETLQVIARALDDALPVDAQPRQPSGEESHGDRPGD